MSRPYSLTKPRASFKDLQSASLGLAFAREDFCADFEHKVPSKLEDALRTQDQDKILN